MGTKPELVENKKWRLEQIRSKLKSFENWSFTTPDEVDSLLYLMREWARLDGLDLTAKELKDAAGNSLFPRLILFCRDELANIATYCESRLSSDEDTLSPTIIQTIKNLSKAGDLNAVEQLYDWLDAVYVVNLLARIMRTSYRAIKCPGILNDLCISEFRGDLFEVIAYTYADINEVMRDEAVKGVKQEENQVHATLAAKKSVSKLSDSDLEKMKERAKALKVSHAEWKISNFAQQLSKEFPCLSYQTIRKYQWLKDLVNPLV